jgi:hypothetical protein
LKLPEHPDVGLQRPAAVLVFDLPGFGTDPGHEPVETADRPEPTLSPIRNIGTDPVTEELHGQAGGRRPAELLAAAIEGSLQPVERLEQTAAVDQGDDAKGLSSQLRLDFCEPTLKAQPPFPFQRGTAALQLVRAGRVNNWPSPCL